MDISHADRAVAAQIHTQSAAPPRDQVLIANVLRARPQDSIDQWLSLGSVCPYWPNQIRERAAWIREIHRQRGEA